MFTEARSSSGRSANREAKRGKTIERICAALEKDTRINLHRYPITLAFAGDDFVLTGELEDIAAKNIPLKLAAAIAPRTGIVDRLTVKAAQPMSDPELRDHAIKVLLDEPALEHCLLHSRLPNQLQTHRDVINGLTEVPAQEDNDDELTDTVCLALEKDPFVNATKTRVAGKGGIVTLEGLVPNETMKRMAERDTWEVLGVRAVVNKIAVKW